MGGKQEGGQQGRGADTSGLPGCCKALAFTLSDGGESDGGSERRSLTHV